MILELKGIREKLLIGFYGKYAQCAALSRRISHVILNSIAHYIAYAELFNSTIISVKHALNMYITFNYIILYNEI